MAQKGAEKITLAITNIWEANSMYQTSTVLTLVKVLWLHSGSKF